MASERPFKKVGSSPSQGGRSSHEIYESWVHGPLELVDENEALAAPETPLVEVDEDIGKVCF